MVEVVEVVVVPVSVGTVVTVVVSMVLVGVVAGNVDVVSISPPPIGIEPLDMQAIKENSNMVTSELNMKTL